MQKSAAPAIAPGISGNIFLVGLMGAGKTSVGRLLARRLGKQFIDSDHQIESRTGVRIPVIFEIEGESGFRQRESAAIDELWNRTRKDRNRPLLQTADPRAKLAELLAVRDPLYREVAHVVMDTGSQSLRTFVFQLEQALVRLNRREGATAGC